MGSEVTCRLGSRALLGREFAPFPFCEYVGGCCHLPGSGWSMEEPCPTDVLISFGDGICFWDWGL